MKVIQLELKQAINFFGVAITMKTNGLTKIQTTYRSEGFPERDVWSLHVMDQGSCQIGRVLGTSPPPSPGSSG